MNGKTQQERQATPLSQKISNTSRAEDQKTDAGCSLSWTVWPMRERPLRSAAVILFLMVVLWAIASAFGTAWIFVSAIILLVYLAGFFFPTRYLLGPESISARGLVSRKKRHWSGLKKYYVGKKGVHLSPYARPSRLESFRGIYLPFGGKREEILRFIEEKMSCGR